MKTKFLLPILALLLISCNGQEYKITFMLDAKQLESTDKIGIRGNIKPLSWEKDYPLTDNNNDGIFETTITFKTSKRNLRYKYSNQNEIELKGSDNRTVWFKPEEGVMVENVFDEFNYNTTETIEKLIYTPEQVKEDLAILKKTLNHIHPNLYKYRDSLELEQDYLDLENKILENPSLTKIYGEISKFAAKIKCSHTFTNPWNQGSGVKRSLFFQPDKLPITFNRIGKRIFLDKNASEDNRLRRGIEILSINAVPSEEILSRLTAYITSDGNNYEKRLQRLHLSGTSKFELFDIFYPITYGSKSNHEIVFKNIGNGDTLVSTVEAISKTRRNTILRERYPDFGNTFEDGWQFNVIDNRTAHLKIDAFTIFSTDFKWKEFIEDAFLSLKRNKTENLIIDIRENEGGDTEVAEYILEHIISEPITIDIPAQTTRYRKIPEDLKKYIRTWDKRPYDWGNKLEYIGNGKYEMQSIFVPTSKTYKPKKNNFQGKVYLLTSAENSSATHIMSTYAKKYKLATLVGQETGGNQKGLNGGYMFFLRLPNSRVELDVPVFGINILKDTPETYDGGIRPDILIEKNVEDFILGKDTELNAVLELIAAQ